MTLPEIRAQIATLLAAGTPKSAVFAQLSGLGIKDSRLAYLIAAHADPQRCAAQRRKVRVLITVMLFRAGFAFVLGLSLGAQFGPAVQWLVGALCAAIPLLFAWGFHTHRAGAYTAYLLLGLAQLPKLFEGIGTSPLSSALVIAFNLALLAYVWHVRQLLFPDLAFVGPRHIRGEYVFSD